MTVLAGGITHGQAVAIALLFIFLIVFLIVDIYLVLFLRSKNKKLAKNREIVSENDGTSYDKSDLTESK